MPKVGRRAIRSDGVGPAPLACGDVRGSAARHPPPGLNLGVLRRGRQLGQPNPVAADGARVLVGRNRHAVASTALRLEQHDLLLVAPQRRVVGFGAAVRRLDSDGQVEVLLVDGDQGTMRCNGIDRIDELFRGAVRDGERLTIAQRRLFGPHARGGQKRRSTMRLRRWLHAARVPRLSSGPQADERSAVGSLDESVCPRCMPRPAGPVEGLSHTNSPAAMRPVGEAHTHRAAQRLCFV